MKTESIEVTEPVEVTNPTLTVVKNAAIGAVVTVAVTVLAQTAVEFATTKVQARRAKKAAAKANQ
ncbi:MAG TPA: hypothetical protein VIJ87_06790 [Pyrinomonadaceae bacterium]